MSPEMGAGKRTVYWYAKLFFLGWFFFFLFFWGGGEERSWCCERAEKGHSDS